MSDPVESDASIVTFYRFIPGARAPQRADRSAAGSMPMRAYRYCESMTSASAFGWYIFPPMSFRLMWDGGTDVVWSFDGADGWFSLTSAQYPDFAKYFDGIAPAELQGYSPPFLGVFKDPAGFNLWSGFAARTAPGWSLLVRPPANLARSQGYESWEGIIETDTWFGPLFANLRLTRPNVPIEFDANYPFLQVQPVHRATYGDRLDKFDVTEGLSDLKPADWEAFRQVVTRPPFDRTRGEYAVKTRRRRKKEVATSSQRETTDSD
jgi:hypothetical protein